MIQQSVLWVIACLACASSALANSFTFTSLDFPGASQTVASGINDSGEIVGYWSGTGGGGFVYQSGAFSVLDVPGTAAGSTILNGVNDEGQIVGEAGNNGFVYSKGAFTTIDVPGATSTDVRAINDLGQMVGLYDDSAGPHAFFYSDGIFTTISTSGLFPFASGINDTDQIVVVTEGPTGSLYQIGSVTPIVFPGASGTEPLGINNLGDIVGDVDLGNFQEGFVEENGVYSVLAFPGATAGTVGVGINNDREIVGFYGDSSGTHGFLLTSEVPEPKMVSLVLLVALLGFVRFRCRNHYIVRP